jgi:outer membrane protein OmpA-like peptidoglycan-associated protein
MGFVLVAVVAAAIWLSPSPPQSKVVLLPGADGKVGALVVKTANKQEVVLDTAYAGATVDAKGAATAQQEKAEDTRARYQSALAAMPPKPRSFVIYFEYGPKVEFVAAAGPVLNELRDYVASLPAPEITVIGHTDTVGTMEANDELSIKRAYAVRDFLIDEGIKAARIDISGRGERELAVPTADEVPEPRNRRVEISVR